VSSSFEESIAAGRAALRSGDAAGARTAFDSALEHGRSGAALDGLGQVAYTALDFARTVELYEAAYAAYREEGNGAGAIRMARTLAYINGAIIGNGAVMQGWHARATALMKDVESSAEQGWVALSRGMFEEDRANRDERFREGLEIARRFADPDLEFASLAYLGANLVHSDRVEEGMLLLDEACAAVVGHDVDDFSVLEEIFCQLFSACEYAHDVSRASEWIRIGEEIAERRHLPAVSAFCRTHYGGVLTAAGRWPEADVALTEAVRLWSLGHTSLRWGALVRLADLRVRQGRLEEAEQLLDGLDVYTEAARPLAALYFAREEHARAVDVVERALGQMDPSSAAAGSLWALLVDFHLALDAIEEAGTAVEHLEEVAARHPSNYLQATAALARGQVSLAAGAGNPLASLREALSGFARAQMPMELAAARMVLASAIAAESPEVAVAEAKAALEAFERLEAARHADAAAALLRSLGGPARTGPRGLGVLTKREAQVLELLGLGLSNPEIGDRLYITRKTVEHHVGNVLAKLGLRSRAEAAVYATREKAGR
jgi:DNA-binding NarL/FixJ family response regulator